MNELWPSGPKRMIWSLLRRSPLREKYFGPEVNSGPKCFYLFAACELRTLRGFVKPEPGQPKGCPGFLLRPVPCRGHIVIRYAM